MKISFYYYHKAPWRECELCFIGPAVLNWGNQILLGLGLFFFEIGIRFRRGEDESDS